jgi:hypothetical protein
MPIPAMKGYASLGALPEEKIGDKITRRILVGEKEMIVFWKMKAGAHAAMHQPPHDIFSHPDMLTGQDTYLGR